jgi:hypothetical protein
MNNKNWFEVDRKGLKELQEGKTKTFVVRELLQNAFDEDITSCKLYLSYNGYNKATIIVEDDSPVGFRDLTDAYTLFKKTYKREDAQKRGRFNLGEKQVFAICDSAEIITTIGGVRFDETGRTSLRKKRQAGSVITINLKMTVEELRECFEYAQQILFPVGIDYTVTMSINNGEFFEVKEPKYVAPFKVFEATLKTEIEFDGAFRPTSRKTKVNLHKTNGKQLLYEMGIPVCEIECDYSIDVQQKVPLSADRDSVPTSYLRDLYAEVLNNVYDNINENIVSNSWIHEATSSNRITEKALETVITERYGDKVVVFNPNDPNANDEAVSRGYHLLKGSELGGDTWKNIKQFELLKSSTAMFGKTLVGYNPVHPTTNQQKVGEWCKKYFRDFFGLNLTVEFISSPKASTIADFEFGGSYLRFNVPKINFKWVEDGIVGQQMLDLIVHEFGHQRGNHTEHSYHECLTKQAAWLTHKALKNPKYFEV